MSSGLERRSPDALARGEWRLFEQLGTEVFMTSDDRRRVLSLTDSEWAAWHGFQRGGVMPGRPSLPDMLIKLATAAYGMAVLLEPEPVGEELFAW